jgi:hypothetical protein
MHGSNDILEYCGVDVDSTPNRAIAAPIQEITPITRVKASYFRELQ